MSLHPELRAVLAVLAQHCGVRQRISAPRDKTVVYSGGLTTPEGMQHAWRMLALAKAQAPARFDYVTLEERLQRFHVVDYGERACSTGRTA